MLRVIHSKFTHLLITLSVKVAINIIVIFYIAKVTSISDFGSFTLAFICSTLVTLMIDFGFNLKVLVLSDHSENEFQNELSAIISGKMILSIATMILLALFLLVTKYDTSTKILIVILAVSAIPNSFGNYFLNTFKVLNNYQQEAKGYLIQGAVLMILLTINHFYGQLNIYYFGIIILISRVLYFFYGARFYLKKFLSIIKINFNDGLSAIITTAPFAIHLILGALIIYIDTLVLSILTNMESVGKYQAGMRLVMAAMLMGTIITDAYLPDISKHLKNRTYVQVKLKNLLNIILCFSLLAITSMYHYFDTIITLLFSADYLSLKTFIWYILSILFLRYLGIVPGLILTSFGFQNIRAKAVVISIVISTILNVVLIPLIGIEGAFLASLISHIALNIVYIYFGTKIISWLDYKHILYIVLLALVYWTLHEMYSFDNLKYLIVTCIVNLLILSLYIKITYKRNVRDIRAN